MLYQPDVIQLGKFELFEHGILCVVRAGIAGLVFGLPGRAARQFFSFERLEFDLIRSGSCGGIHQLKGQVERAVMVNAGFCDNERFIHNFFMSMAGFPA